MDQPIEFDCLKVPGFNISSLFISNLEWLFERKKIPKDWQKLLKSIELALKKHIDNSQISYDEINLYLQEAKYNFNYYHLNQICEKLLQTDEAKQLTIFRNYSSKLLTEWLALRQLFTKNNLHLVQLGRILHQNLIFEIPSCKKHSLTLRQQQQETYSKISDSENSIKIIENDFKQNCNKIGIEGSNIEKEIKELILQLPQSLTEFTNQLRQKNFQEILSLYEEFSVYINQKNSSKEKTIELLQYLYTNGDDILEIYEAKLNNQEISQELIQFNQNKYENFKYLVQNEQKFEQIDEIQWDFEIIDEAKVQNEKNIEDANDNEINWDIVVDDDQSKQMEFEITKEDNKSPIQDKEQSFHETLITQRSTRNTIVNELLEVPNFNITIVQILHFLKQRIKEQGNDQQSLLQAYDQTTSSKLFEHSVQDLTEKHNYLQKLIDLLTNQRVTNLFNFKEQPKVQEKTKLYLEQFLHNKEKQQQSILRFQKRINEIQQALIESSEKLNTLMKETQMIGRFVEEEMSVIVKHSLKMTGEINRLA